MASPRVGVILMEIQLLVTWHLNGHRLKRTDGRAWYQCTWTDFPPEMVFDRCGYLTGGMALHLDHFGWYLLVAIPPTTRMLRSNRSVSTTVQRHGERRDRTWRSTRLKRTQLTRPSISVATNCHNRSSATCIERIHRSQTYM